MDPSRPDFEKLVTLTSKPERFLTTCLPIEPNPITPILLSESEVNRRWSQVPAIWSRINSGKPRLDASASPTASSAVEAS